MPPGTWFEVVDAPEAVQPSGTLTYTLVVGNSDDFDHPGTVVEAAYSSARVTFVSSDPAPDLGSDHHWTLGTIDAGKSKSVTVQVTAKPTVTDGETIALSATVASTGEDSMTAEESTKVAVQAAGKALLQLSVSALPDPVRPGEQTRYVVSYRNAGLGTSMNTALRWTPAQGMAFVGSTLDPTETSALETVFPIGNLASGASGSFTFFSTLAHDVPVGSVRKACLEMQGFPVAPAAATAGLTAKACTPVVAASDAASCGLNLKQRVLGAAIAGKTVKYSLLWFDSCFDVTGAKIELTLPPDVEFEGASLPGTTLVDGRTVEFDYGNVAAQTIVDTRLRLRIPASVANGTQLETVARLTDAAARTVSTNTSVIARTKTTSSKQAPSIGIAGTRIVRQGGSVTYTVRYRDAVSGGSLVVTLPGGLAPYLVSPPPTLVDGVTMRWNDLTATSGVLRIRARAQLPSPSAPLVLMSTTAVLKDDASVETARAEFNTVATEAGAPGPTPDGNSAPTLAVTGVRFGSPAELLQVDVRYREALGPSSLTLHLPPELTVERVLTPPSLHDGNTMRWDGLRGSSFAVKLRLLIAGSVTPGTSLSISASISDAGGSSASGEYSVLIR